MNAEATQPAKLRLRTQRDFRSVYGRGKRASGDLITVVVWQRRKGEILAPRIGVSVSKDHGGAVRRNKLKRILRESFRLERRNLPPDVDVILIPKKRSEHLPLSDLREELPRLVKKALHAPKRRPRKRRS